MAALATLLTKQAGGTFTITHDTGGSSGDTMTIPAPGPGKIIRICDVMVIAAGTVTGTAFSMTTTASTVRLAAAGLSATATGNTVFSFSRPIACLVNDAPILTFTVPGATASSLFATVNYEVVPA